MLVRENNLGALILAFILIIVIVYCIGLAVVQQCAAGACGF